MKVAQDVKDVDLYESSLNKLVELSQRLECKVGELLHAYKKGYVSQDSARLWKGYYKGQLTQWFITVWPDFKSACHTLRTRHEYSVALERIANVKIMAFTSDPDRWNKGHARELVIDNLKQALIDCNKTDIAESFSRKFDELVMYVDENFEDKQTNPQYTGSAKSVKHIARTSANIELQINMQLFKLPKHLYQQAREFVFKDSNLERNLHQFKQQHNLT